MTLPGHHPLERSKLKRFARLMQIHLLTHPERVARRHGVSAEYVRRQFRNMQAPNMLRMAHELETWLAERET